MDKIVSFIPVIGPVVAAAITAVIAFVLSVLAKENKISEFRQAWIESLRTDVSELLGDFHTLEISLRVSLEVAMNDYSVKMIKDKFMSDNRKEYSKVDALCNKVVLRLNPSEHQHLIDKIRRLEETVGAGSASSHALSVEMVEAFSKLFKAEWERVKSGETIFKRMKVVALVCVSAILAIGTSVLYITMNAK